MIVGLVSQGRVVIGQGAVVEPLALPVVPSCAVRRRVARVESDVFVEAGEGEGALALHRTEQSDKVGSDPLGGLAADDPPRGPRGGRIECWPSSWTSSGRVGEDSTGRLSGLAR